VKLLIDECLHTSLVAFAHSAGHSADHVSHRGLGGLKDWQLMLIIREQEYTFVTNNRSDFLDFHSREPLHAGVITERCRGLGGALPAVLDRELDRLDDYLLEIKTRESQKEKKHGRKQSGR
jgi:predicted nuclease of predicted toxin-antitoxin system